MNKILLLFTAVSTGAIGFGALRVPTEHKRASAVVAAGDWVSITNRVINTLEEVTLLRDEVLTKKERLRTAARHPDFSPELLHLIEGGTLDGSERAWVELRQLLGIGWVASPDYVLVSRPALKDLDYGGSVSDRGITGTACQLLAVSTDEATAIRSLVQRTKEGAPALAVERGEPTGDVVAQYSARPMDSGTEQSLSNNFAAGLSAALGQERAELLLHAAWLDVRSDLGPRETETMIVRRTEDDGQPDLVCEMTRGTQNFSIRVRYAHYPSSWFLSQFPGGWKTLADKEGFDLPPKYQNQPSPTINR